jgi:hypothetical protein
MSTETYTPGHTRNATDFISRRTFESHGHKFGEYLAAAGFRDITMSARYECYPSLSLIREYLALQLEQRGYPEHAKTLLEWSRSDAGMFAQAWVSAIDREAWSPEIPERHR